MRRPFQLVSEYSPAGDQPQAIEKLTADILSGKKFHTLLGATGTGKTFTMANVIQNVGKPTLILSHNKTLAAQLYGEFLAYFPHNAVEYFISYYDYYQPEAYIPRSDTYIEKDASINEEIDKLRLKATSRLFERDDVIIVASVSCIYGLGSPKDYYEMLVYLEVGDQVERDAVLHKLVDIQYNRNDYDFGRGTFRVRGDVVEVHPAYEDNGVRIEFWGDTVERITLFDALKGDVLQEMDRCAVYPAKHFVTTERQLESAIVEIEKELTERIWYFKEHDRFIEAQRIQERTTYDIEMMREVGYCSGIENYSRHLAGRKAGERPYCLLDYFPKDFLMIIDESHVTIPQLHAMYGGDRSRKSVLIEHGFRLPSAADNRPLKFEEFEALLNQCVFVSATPGAYELEKSENVVVEQIIRPTGLVDPEVEVRPVTGQIDDLLEEIRLREDKDERVLVTTLTKRMAEQLTDYLEQMQVRVRYMHSDIHTIERVEILRGLRLGEFDVLVGINLLREGLDLPEVSLVAILDADKEGFLRSERSLIQTIGRAARNVKGKVIMYADSITDSMKRAIDETNRRRQVQLTFNETHGITPRTITKSIDQIRGTTVVADAKELLGELPEEGLPKAEMDLLKGMPLDQQIRILEDEMEAAAQQLEFEKAAMLRDKVKALLKEKQKK
ncbi:MAG: excinuclease ABC subunit UvrB [Gemmatimonadetes bacterium]|nr:MAG: excinuclease ABC subunit UvrB [Gemmatimonadota bacterium]